MYYYMDHVNYHDYDHRHDHHDFQVGDDVNDHIVIMSMISSPTSCYCPLLRVLKKSEDPVISS